MKNNFTIFLILFAVFAFFETTAQLPNPSLVGYWHNWDASSAPYVALDAVDNRYNVINIAFGTPINGTDYEIGFSPVYGTQTAFKAKMQVLQSQGKKVILSLGGAGPLIKLDNITERNVFISSVSGLMTTYGFDGIDIDFEGSSITVSGGTIANPTDMPLIHLINGIKSVMQNYRTTFGRKMLLTMAPETAFVQGGQSAYSSIWGAYLPVIHGLRDSLDLLHVQLYNSGSMYGINGGIYTQATADFIVAMTEATIQGYNVDRWSNQAGPFIGLPASKIAIGLPACPSAAGGGFTDTTTVRAAMNYLRGIGPKPGTYTLQQVGGYPQLRGMMTWSINWDKVSTCNSSAYAFAENFVRIFSNVLPVELVSFQANLQEPEAVALSWTTASEQNNEYFTVERSVDGKVWEEITEVKSQGNASDNQAYHYIDLLLPKSDILFYRLKQTDFDGLFHYSDVEVVRVPLQGNDFTFFPNPAHDFMTIQYPDWQYVTTCTIFNALGQTVDNHILESQETFISIRHLPKGIYFLQMKDSPTMHTFVVMH